MEAWNQDAKPAEATPTARPGVQPAPRKVPMGEPLSQAPARRERQQPTFWGRPSSRTMAPTTATTQPPGSSQPRFFGDLIVSDGSVTSDVGFPRAVYEGATATPPLPPPHPRQAWGTSAQAPRKLRARPRGHTGHFPAAPPPAPLAQIDSFIPWPPNATISFPNAAATRPPRALPRHLGPLCSVRAPAAAGSWRGQPSGSRGPANGPAARSHRPRA